MSNRNSAALTARIGVQDNTAGPLRRAGANISRYSRQGETSLGRLRSSFGGLRGIITATAGVLAGSAISRGVGALVNQARGVEDAVARFQPLLGGVEAAQRAVAALNETAASTPFQFDQLASSASTILGFGVATEAELIPMLRMLGDTAGGSADRLNGITLAFSQIAAGGRATMQDVNQLINNGVPILGELAAMWGVTAGEAREMISTGRATSDEVTQAFQRMTTEGGRFYRGMEIASRTTSGIFSTLRDNIQLTAASLGSALLPTIQRLAEDVTAALAPIRAWVEANQQLIQQRVEDTIERIGRGVQVLGDLWQNGTIPALLAAVATFRTLTAAVAIAQGALLALRAAQASAAAAGGVLNAVLAANPIGLIVVGISAAVAGIILLIRNWDRLADRFRNSRLGQWLAGSGERLDSLASSNLERYGTPEGSPQLLSANDSTIRTYSESYSERTSRLEIDFPTAPTGTRARMSGSQAPDIRVNFGGQGAVLQ